jgi:hypothetical protein
MPRKLSSPTWWCDLLVGGLWMWGCFICLFLHNYSIQTPTRRVKSMPTTVRVIHQIDQPHCTTTHQHDPHFPLAQRTGEGLQGLKVAMVPPHALQEQARALPGPLEALLHLKPDPLLRVVLPKALQLLPLVLG